MELIIQPRGTVIAIYDELIDLSRLGPMSIKRASQIEPGADGRWFARIVNGPELGPFSKRSEAVAAEVAWLIQHRLGTS